MSEPEPRANPALLGQERAEATLLEAWRSGRLPHAWVFAGPAGVGKATAAFRFARFLLATPVPSAEPAGLFGAPEPVESLALAEAHPVFRRVAAGSHADLKTIERTQNEKTERLRKEIAVDDVRTIAPFLRLTAAEEGWRVAIVDEAEALNRQGQNALLKILEEPPPRGLLILVTDRPAALLPTVRSRCRMLSFASLSEEGVGGMLRSWRPDLQSGEVAALARLSDGSIGQALALADNDGLALFEELMRLLTRLPALDRAAVHRLADRMGATGAEAAFARLSELLRWWLARAARALATGQRPSMVAHSEAAAFAQLQERLAGRRDMAGLAALAELWEKVGRRFDLAAHANLDRRVAVIGAFEALAATL